jgi:hypothetical protein
MAPPGSAHLNFSLGGLVMLGDTMGYFKKDSTMSLVAGLGFGGLLVGSGILITQGESYQGHVLAWPWVLDYCRLENPCLQAWWRLLVSSAVLTMSKRHWNGCPKKKQVCTILIEGTTATTPSVPLIG